MVSSLRRFLGTDGGVVSQLFRGGLGLGSHLLFQRGGQASAIGSLLVIGSAHLHFLMLLRDPGRGRRVYWGCFISDAAFRALQLGLAIDARTPRSSDASLS